MIFNSKTDRSFPHCKGFTLIEVVLAIGIFSFAFTLILGLLSMSVRSGDESSQKIQAAQILSKIDLDLRNQSKKTVESPFFHLDLSPSSSKVTFLYFNENLDPILETDPDRYYQVECTLKNIAPNLLTAHLCAYWPHVSDKKASKGLLETTTYLYLDE